MYGYVWQRRPLNDLWNTAGLCWMNTSALRQLTIFIVCSTVVQQAVLFHKDFEAYRFI